MTYFHQLNQILLSFKVGLLGSLFHLSFRTLSVDPPPLILDKYHGVVLFSLDAAIQSFCEMLEDFCGRATIPTEDQNEPEWLSLPVADIRMLVNEIMSIRAKKLLHLVSVDVLVRLLQVLDHQIHRAEGLSIDERVHVSYSDNFLLVVLVVCDCQFFKVI